jgi:DNA invertase Pin-like site-specific DNA recombinase
MIYGYLRVSSDEQDVNNQKLGVEKFAEQHGWKIESYITDEGVSGTKDPSKRSLGKLLRKIKKGDIVVCSEISRLGRNLLMIMSILQNIMKRNAMLYTVKDNYILGDNIQSTVLAFAFGLAAQIERDMISMRTKEALARKKAEGVKLGHPRGTRMRLNPRCESRYDFIVAELAKGTQKTILAKKCKVSKTTFYRYLIYKNLHDPIGSNQQNWIENGVYH